MEETNYRAALLKPLSGAMCVVKLAFGERPRERKKEREMPSRCLSDELAFTGTLRIPMDVCGEKSS